VCVVRVRWCALLGFVGVRQGSYCRIGKEALVSLAVSRVMRLDELQGGGGGGGGGTGWGTHVGWVK
jgi:hypothetical protein